MKVLIIVLCLSVFTVDAFRENLTVADLPDGCPAQLLSMLTKGAITITGGCKDLQETDVELALYTRTTSDKPILLNATNPIELDPTKKLVILIHGWLSNRNESSLPQLKDAYLARYDCNLLIVDWGTPAWKLYTTSVCYVPKIAELVANFLCLLDKEYGVSVDTVHLVGHSLGGQMSGYIGQNTFRMCKKKPARITAMDPAGPLYQGRPKAERLDKSDATFVDVIHTNAGFLGYQHNCGHTDFYVNCGTFQLGCTDDLSFSLEGIKKLPVSAVTCHHSRSVLYMVESVTSTDFQGRGCNDCPSPCVPTLTLFRALEIVMGEDCPVESTGGYVLVTNRQPPFGVGTTDVIKKVSSLAKFL